MLLFQLLEQTLQKKKSLVDDLRAEVNEKSQGMKEPNISPSEAKIHIKIEFFTHR